MKTLTLVLASGILMAAQIAWAGPSSGGGGMAVTCRNEDGAIKSTELLDVYEAKQNPKLNVMRASGSIQEDYLRTVDNTYTLQGSPNLSESRKQEILENLEKFMDSVDWSKSLPFLNDQGHLSAVLPESCALEQLAIFYDSTQRISINKEIWDRLDSLNRAALVQHELFYHFERMFGENTSESTRSYVRQIVSMDGFIPVLSGTENSLSRGFAVDKDGNLTAFYVRNDVDPNSLTLQFTHIGGRALLVQTIVNVPGLILAAECSIDRNLNEKICYPALDANIQIRLPVVTEHRKDWEILVKYVTGQPISITLLQKGVPVTHAIVTSLDKE